MDDHACSFPAVLFGVLHLFAHQAVHHLARFPLCWDSVIYRGTGSTESVFCSTFTCVFDKADSCSQEVLLQLDIPSSHTHPTTPENNNIICSSQKPALVPDDLNTLDQSQTSCSSLKIFKSSSCTGSQTPHPQSSI